MSARTADDIQQKAYRAMMAAYVYACRAGLDDSLLNQLLSPAITEERKMSMLAILTDTQFDLAKAYLECVKIYEETQVEGELVFIPEKYSDPFIRGSLGKTTVTCRLLTAISHKNEMVYA